MRLLRINVSLLALLAACLQGPCLVAATAPALQPQKQTRRTRQTVSVARIVLKGDYPEGPQQADLFSAKRETLGGILGRMRKATDDPEIAGLVLRIDNLQIGWGKLHELRTGIAQFRKSGKKVMAELNLALMSDYLLATACDEIVMPPSGMLMVTGLRAEVTFYKGLLDQLGIQADLMQIGDYKGAGEPFGRSSLSPNQRAQIEAVLDDHWDHLVGQVAEARGLKPPQVEAAIDQGPFTPTRAHALGLIDAVAYEDETAQLFQRRLGARRVLVENDYGRKKPDTDFSGLAGMVKMMNLMLGITAAPQPTTGPKIAVIYASGMILPGDGFGGLFGGAVMDSDTIIQAIRRAAQDPQVAAIVMRVNSPGGSAMASDLIWREVVRTEKPLVVSMGDTAASGGYYISMGADRIFAEPDTLTGSIGVIGGKVALRGLYEKLGITTETLRRGKNSGAFSLTDPFSDSERQAVLMMMNDTYDQFVTKAAQGRRIDRARMEQLAGGRVWTGRMAKENGLVDQLGILADAVAEAKVLAGLRRDDRIELLPLPRPKTVLEQLLSDGSARHSHPAQGVTDGSAGLQHVLPSALLEALRQARAWESLLQEPVLTLVPFRVTLR